jgi:hypothetical protein
MGQLTLSRGTIKKGDDVADDDDNDAVRTSVSQDQVTATLCTKEIVPHDSVYIALITYQTDKNEWGGYMTHMVVPA